MTTNFDLRVRMAEQPGRYVIEVLGSPDGESPPVQQDAPQFSEEFLAAWRENRLSGGEARAFGEQLYAWLFPAPVAGRLLASRRRVEGRNQTLRLRLRIDPVNLSRLPWELCWSEDDRFLSLHPDLTVVRYIAEPVAPSPLHVPETLRLIVALASPHDLPALDTDGEAALITESVMQAGNRVDARVVPHCTWDSLQSALSEGADAVHFVGHGGIGDGGEGFLAFEDEVGGTNALSAEQLHYLFQGREVRLVVLNACQSALAEGQDGFLAVAPALVRSGIPAVVAQQSPVPDGIAKQFARSLYTYLARGRTLDETMTEMRLRAYGAVRKHAYWGVPVLFMRAPDGKLWEEAESANPEKSNQKESNGGVSISNINNSEIRIGNLVGRDFTSAGDDDTLREEGDAEE